MTEFIDKELIERRFSKSSETYNSNAMIQRVVVKKIITMLKELGFTQFGKLLEIGCGTGLLTKEIIKNFTIDELLINDLSDSSFDELSKYLIHEKASNFQFIKADAETLKLSSLDAILSTSSFQWFGNFANFVNNISQQLNNQGIIAFSTFGPSNYIEVKKLLNVGLNYLSLKQQVEILSNKFHVIEAQEWCQQLYFEHPCQVLSHIKSTGVNGISNSYFGKEKLKQFINNYSQSYTALKGNIHLTYHPIIIIAQKK